MHKKIISIRKLIAETITLATMLNKSKKAELPEEIYKAISYFWYELRV